MTKLENTYKNKILTVPNILSFFRLCLIPLIVWLYMEKQDYLLTLIVLTLSGITDIADGIIARKCNMISDFGKAFDPIADKLMVFGAFLCFLVADAYAPYRYIFAVIVFVVLLREFAVTSIRLVAQSSGGKVIAANMLGKIKTVTQIIFILAALLEKHLFFFCDFMVKYTPITIASCLVMFVFTVLSGANYLLANKQYIDPKK